MHFARIPFAARPQRAVFILACALVTGVLTFALPASAGTGTPGRTAAAKPADASNPRWEELTAAQKQALAPLAGEWNKLDAFRKSKWLAIGNKYAAMRPEEQERMQERMRDWVRLTPEQRRAARESYVRAGKLHPEQKSEQWEKYQQLPEEQKKDLAAKATPRKRVTVLPRTAVRPSAGTPSSKPVPAPAPASVPPIASPASADPAGTTSPQPEN